MKTQYLLILFPFLCALGGCASLTQSLEHRAAQCLSARMESSKFQSEGYPAAYTLNASLVNHPPTVNLSRYKSVQTRPNQRPDIALALAASGGGYRAANLTTGVLLGLENITDPSFKGNLLQEVDYFSTVSGGGLGVGVYINALYQHYQAETKPFNYHTTVAHLLREGCLNPLARDYSDILFFDAFRGQKIEDVLNNNVFRTRDGKNLVLGDMFIPRHSVRPVLLPYWVPNATVYQNASIFPFAPNVLAQYQVSRYPFGSQYHILAGSFSDLAYGYDLPMAVGLTASMSFPFALPPVTLQSYACTVNPCYLQLLDGGMADNLGVYTALDLLRQDKSPIKVLIVVDAYKGYEQPFSQAAKPPSDVDLFRRIMSLSTDASRQNLRSRIQMVSRDVLCQSGAKNVLVAYLDLSQYPRAKLIGTGLLIHPDEQTLLLNVGQALVANNQTLNVTLKALARGDVRIGACKKESS